VDIFAEGDPAIERSQTLIDALGHPPALSAFEQATIARLAAWVSPSAAMPAACHG
jgi:hypothetical protein